MAATGSRATATGSPKRATATTAPGMSVPCAWACSTPANPVAMPARAVPDRASSPWRAARAPDGGHGARQGEGHHHHGAHRVGSQRAVAPEQRADTPPAMASAASTRPSSTAIGRRTGGTDALPVGCTGAVAAGTLSPVRSATPRRPPPGRRARRPRPVRRACARCERRDAATCSSWVTSRMAWPPACSRRNSSSTSRPPSESSAPVGSSAKAAWAGWRAPARWRGVGAGHPTARRGRRSPCRRAPACRAGRVPGSRPGAVPSRRSPRAASRSRARSCPRRRLKNWNTIPMWAWRMRARAFSSLSASDSPATMISPSVGVSSPATRLSSVDFPHPDGPMMATNFVLPHRQVDPASARTAPLRPRRSCARRGLP